MGTTHTHDIAAARLSRSYSPRRASAARMRRALRAYLASQGVDARVVRDVVLATEEAFINALVHGGAEERAIHVSAWVSRGTAFVEIEDGGRGFSFRASKVRVPPDVRLSHGRGLFLMQTIMDHVTVRTGKKGTTVRMTRRIARA